MAREWPKYWKVIENEKQIKTKKLKRKSGKNLTHGIPAEYPK
jgi:hypothetical protein